MFSFLGFSGGSNFRSQNGGMGGRGGNFMDQPGGNRGGGMGRYPDSGSREFGRPNIPQFPGGSRGGDRRQDFESLPPPPS